MATFKFTDGGVTIQGVLPAITDEVELSPRVVAGVRVLGEDLGAFATAQAERDPSLEIITFTNIDGREVSITAERLGQLLPGHHECANIGNEFRAVSDGGGWRLGGGGVAPLIMTTNGYIYDENLASRARLISVAQDVFVFAPPNVRLVNSIFDPVEPEAVPVPQETGFWRGLIEKFILGTSGISENSAATVAQSKVYMRMDIFLGSLGAGPGGPLDQGITRKPVDVCVDRAGRLTLSIRPEPGRQESNLFPWEQNLGSDVVYSVDKFRKLTQQ